VARGRGRTEAEIEAVARGRVWSGRDAVQVGLVDQLGGLREAASVARTRAGLPDDAPVLPALQVPPLARLGRARNSDDPRALLTPVWPAVPDLAAALGDLDGVALRMNPFHLR
jgi:protease-4